MLGNGSCYNLPAPLGDPDHAWADPRVSGVWLDADSGELFLFEPFDARTWLVQIVGLRMSQGAREPPGPGAGEQPQQGGTTGERPDAAGQLPADREAILQLLKEGRLTIARRAVYKGWAVTLGERRFLVLEPKGSPTQSHGFRPQGWFGFSLVLEKDRLLLKMIKGDKELEGVTTRSAAEAIVARRAADPKFYEEPLVLDRVPPAFHNFVGGLVGH